MAVYRPSESWEAASNICRIIRAEEIEGYTRYVIQVYLPPFKWHVHRRYRQFVELHEKIVKSFSLDKKLLPPKKVFGNKSENFIHERKKALELYLQTVIHQFNLLPEPLTKFLDFEKYEIRGITAALAETFFCQGDLIIAEIKEYEFSPMQLHAITERLKLLEPTCYSHNPKQDIAHLVEFITQLQHLKIIGSNEFFKDSNIIPNSLSFDITLFKNLNVLEIFGCSLEGNLLCVDTLRQRLKSLIIHKSLEKLSTILLCGIVHWSEDSSLPSSWPVWQCITYADFSNNSLIKIDPSIKLLTSVTHLDLSQNELSVVENLDTLSDLSTLILSQNKIEDLESLHTKLGNINTLYLSSNKIKKLQGLAKLFSVTKLHLDNNSVTSFHEISYLSKLPCIEILNLQNNPVTLNVDYRSQVLLIFGPHASEIELDGLKPTEKEIDTVSVLQALKQARGENYPSSDSDDSHPEPDKGAISHCNKDVFAAFDEKDASLGGKRTFQEVSNIFEASKFRQQIEALRRVGGSDWLRLLNERNYLSEGPSKFISEEQYNSHQESTDLLHTTPTDKEISQLSPQHIASYTISTEISYPECISLLDANNESFKHQFISALIKHRAYSDGRNETINQIHSTYSSLLPEAKLVWLVLFISKENSVSEIPICLVMFKSEIVLLRVKSFSKSTTLDSCCDTSLFPDFSYFKCILPHDILSIMLGPCLAYTHVKIKSEENVEILIFLCNHVDMGNLFIEYCDKFYSISPVYMQHPFTNNIINFHNLHSRLSNISFQNHILYNQRVLVSKILHKCHFGLLHYIFITPSHIILMEERLCMPEVVGIETNVQPQFQVCAVVNVHTNLKQIHLKDIDIEESNAIHCDEPEQIHLRPETLVVNKQLEVLYKCGSWLLIEFESGVLFCLKFFSLKQRNEFLDAFLCARSQK